MQNEIWEIDSSRVFLRRFRREDAEKVWQMSRENGMKEWLPDQVYTDLDHAKEVLTFLIQQYQDDSTPQTCPIVFGVCLKTTEELIGHVGLSPCEDEVEVGYAIEDAQHGKGYATEAVRAATNWALRHFHLPRILGIVSAENPGSCQVLQKSGFSLLDQSKRTLHSRFTLVQRWEKRSTD